MKIAQLTDLHIGFKGEDTYGVDVRANFLRILDHIVANGFDQVVLTGDLCFRAPYQEIYLWVKSEFDARGLSPWVIPGNHDTSQMVAECMGMAYHDQEVHYAKEWSGHLVLFLDSGRAELSDSQWQWLENETTPNNRPILVFMHHPPVLAGTPFMDTHHAFGQIDRFNNFAEKLGQRLDVFCGHYHIEHSVQQGDLHVHITPSTFFQIKKGEPAFAIDHYNIGYRVIDLNGKLSHHVEYLD